MPRSVYVAALLLAMAMAGSAAQPIRRLLYVAVPGAGSQNEYRGVGILVYDIENGHTFVKRIPTWPPVSGQEPEQVRGIAASASARRLYVSTVKRLAAFDLVTEKIIWETTYEGDCCDRIGLSPDGATIYAPAFGAPKWYVVDAASGALAATIGVMGWPRQAMFSADRAYVYLSAWESPVLSVVDAKSRKVIREVGPFTSFPVPIHDQRQGVTGIRERRRFGGLRSRGSADRAHSRSRRDRGIPNGGWGRSTSAPAMESR